MNWKNIFTVIIAICVSQIAIGQDNSKIKAKTVIVKGTILSQDQKPVKGAVFYVDSIKTNGKSNIDGYYEIEVNPTNLKLIAYSTEFGVGEALLLVTDTTVVNITLNGVAKSPKPIKIKPKKVITYTDIYMMIRGEVSGVVVNGRSITVTTQNSFTGDREVLVMVNGSITSNISGISPNDVKSIEFLRGSAVTAYGTNAANGIISITLLKGGEK